MGNGNFVVSETRPSLDLTNPRVKPVGMEATVNWGSAHPTISDWKNVTVEFRVDDRFVGYGKLLWSEGRIAKYSVAGNSAFSLAGLGHAFLPWPGGVRCYFIDVEVKLTATDDAPDCDARGESFGSIMRKIVPCIRKSEPGGDPPPEPLVDPFKDVEPNSTHAAAINGLRTMNLIGGYQVADGWEFRPTNPVLRAQFAKMIVGALDLEIPAEGGSQPFGDLGADDPNNLYPHQYVAAAYEQGIIKGKTANSFAPWANVTRSQAVTMIVRSLRNLYPDLLTPIPAGYVGSWGNSYDPEQAPLAALAQYNGLLDGLDLSGTASNPYSPMPREEVAQILWNAMQKPVLTLSGTVTGMRTIVTEEGDITQQEGPLSSGLVFVADQNGGWLASTETNESGEYTLELKVGWASGWTKDGLPCLVGTSDFDGYTDVYWDKSNPVLFGIPGDVRIVKGDYQQDFQLAKACTITGWVSTMGEPVEGARVSALAQGKATALPAYALTSGGGYYHLDVPAGTYSVKATYNGAEVTYPELVTLSLDSEGDWAFVDLEFGQQ